MYIKYEFSNFYGLVFFFLFNPCEHQNAIFLCSNYWCENVKKKERERIYFTPRKRVNQSSKKTTCKMVSGISACINSFPKRFLLKKIETKKNEFALFLPFLLFAESIRFCNQLFNLHGQYTSLSVIGDIKMPVLPSASHSIKT